METKVRTIVVLWDFSPKAEFAYAHAASISKNTGNEIALLHVVKGDSEVASAQAKLNDVAQKLSETFGVVPKTIVLKGNIFKTIASYTASGGIEMISMVTHGIKGLQRLTGSWALKVIHGSRVPFFVVQDMPKREKIEKIVFPIDFKSENKESLKWASYLCKLYHSKIYMVHPVVNDHIFKKRIHSNIVFAQKYFDSSDIHFEIKAIGKKMNVAHETIEFAKEINADLILVMVPKALTFVDYVFLRPSEQLIIANDAKIPVMVLNPKPKATSGGFSATGG
jgi:nucleotide-binding universal stress UspA family protein